VTGLSNVEEVVEKFLSRNEKNSQLQAVAEDLKKRIAILKEDNDKSKVSQATAPALKKSRHHSHTITDPPFAIHAFPR
jgi:cell shape-determining protein MreC